MDSAFQGAPFPAYTIAELRAFIARGSPRAAVMAAEIARREAVAAGDMSRATPAERLRAVQESRHA